MTARPKLAVGDELFLVDHIGRAVRKGPVIVTKVGRKWASIVDKADARFERPRINLDNWICDGGNYTSPGRCYASQEEYEAEQRLSLGWNELQKRMRDQWSRPPHITIEDIATMSRILDDNRESKA